MERKIGEIFEYQGEWYQCLPERCMCDDCAFKNDITCVKSKGIRGECQSASRQKDGVIFKKLEKVGGTYAHNSVIVQKYRIIATPVIMPNEPYMYFNAINNTIDIEIKQNKEDMEENKITFPKEDNALTRTVYAYVNGKISDKELIRSIKEMSDEYPYNKNNLKPFSLELAKQGKPVCTRDGRKARIICFDKKGAYPIVALVNDYNEEEYIKNYDEFGKKFIGGETSDDLMMLPEKKEGWVNICRDAKDDDRIVLGSISESREEAVESAPNNDRYTTIATVRIEWEE